MHDVACCLLLLFALVVYCLNTKLLTLLDVCASSLRRGHANLLCIVPVSTDDPRREPIYIYIYIYIYIHTHTFRPVVLVQYIIVCISILSIVLPHYLCATLRVVCWRSAASKVCCGRFGFRVQGLGFGVQGLGFRVLPRAGGTPSGQMLMSRCESRSSTYVYIYIYIYIHTYIYRHCTYTVMYSVTIHNIYIYYAYIYRHYIQTIYMYTVYIYIYMYCLVVVFCNGSDCHTCIRIHFTNSLIVCNLFFISEVQPKLFISLCL